MANQCTGKNRTGEPCGAQAWQDGLCRWHHPGLAADRAEWRTRGGKAKSNKARAKKQLPDSILSPAELEGVIGITIKRVLTGVIEPGPANAIASLCRAAVSVREATAIDERLAALEARIGIEDRRRA